VNLRAFPRRFIIILAYELAAIEKARFA